MANSKTKKKTISKKTKSIKKMPKSDDMTKHNIKISVIIIILVGILLIFSTYAWFSVNLNVRIKTFNMSVTKNSGLSISFDAINFDTSVEISYDNLIRNLRNTYPNNLSQWASGGLTPVSSVGLSSSNTYFFDMYSSGGGIRYPNKTKENGFFSTSLIKENSIKQFNSYIAFDLFFKNDSGSPIEDNLYLDYGTEIVMDGEATEEMYGLLNSVRVGFVKVGTLGIDENPTTIQNLQCNNNCQAIIYEPNSRNHTDLSIERAAKYGVTLENGERYTTYGTYKSGGPIYVANAVSGSPNLDTRYFTIQNTITEENFDDPLFTVPYGITKVRVYLWIEGQDIDSLETDSEGADISISINFIKDTQGYEAFN